LSASHTHSRPIEVGNSRITSRSYANYVLLMLTLCYVVNVVDRSQVLAASVQAIKAEFGASDFQMGLLSGLPFALFYSLMGIPIAAWADRSSRRNVLVLAVATWSGMTALFGTAVNFTMLFLTRIGTAIGEAGGSPPSHSLISDYFPKARRGTAFAIYALAVPVGTSIGAAIGGWGNQNLGWRNTFIAIGLPGIVLALIVFLTLKSCGFSGCVRRFVTSVSRVRSIRWCGTPVARSTTRFSSARMA
jgi:MFS family permease